MENRHLWKEYSPTARGVEEHFEDLSLKIEDLRGKKILDIGAGLNQLANELKNENLDIVSLDPFYALSKVEREEIYERGYEDGPEKLKELLDQLKSKDGSSKLIAGRSEALPFPNDSFDLIISHYGSPFYAENAEKIEQFFLELSRVLKSGGEARIYPIWLQGADAQKNSALTKALEDLGKKGFHIRQIGSAWLLSRD